ncbi:XrtA/PEP-CTERM system TPR-repeat protein PrsT [Rugamonas sp.]|uniref:XrtA/PEP-CTERM system TPR-repeat protein PrsT n=1 Tax=Rugamonas sp. TaxID=1926287 RepID=UPI0025D98B07|nr:XrtA/PEP-CTERM system TPR-repeat protein PrsT [Rugamonas sp.]
MLTLPPGWTVPPRRWLRWPCVAVVLSLVACHGWQSNEQLLARARHYQQLGQNRAAVIELKNVLQNDPRQAVARTLLGKIYLDQGDVLSAEKELRRAQALGVGKDEIVPALGRALLMQGEFDKVLNEVGASPQRPQWMALRAAALLGLHKVDLAEAAYKALLLQYPGDGVALLGLARVAQERHQDVVALSLATQALAAHPDDLDMLRLRAGLLHAQGDNAAALQCDERIVKLRPEDIQAHIDIANLHLQAGRYAAARAEIASARKVGPGNLLVAYTQALLDFREGKLPTALDQLQQVLRAAPEHMPSTLLIGAVELGLGSLPQAEQYLKKFLESDARNPYATKLLSSVMLKNNNPDAALKLIAPLLPDNQHDVEMMALAGEASMRLRRFEQAEAYYRKASALAPDMAMLHAALGMARIGQGQNAQAIVELERATALEAGNSRAGVLLVLSYMRDRQLAQALVAVNRLLRQQPDNPLLHNLKGGVLMANQDVAGARASFLKAVALKPRYMPALDNLTQLDLKDKQADQARLRLVQAWSQDKKNAAIMTALAKLATSQGHYAEAESWLELSSKAHPDALAPALLLANFYHQAGEQQKSLPLAQKLQASNPASPDALALLAEVHTRGGNYRAALDNFTKLAQLQPDSAAVQMRIATTELTLADEAAALQALEKALALQPDFPQARVDLVKLLTERGAYSEALSAAREMQAQHPNAPLGLKLEGDILMAQNQPLPALAIYQRAYAMDHSGPLLIPVFNALRRAGRGDEANTRMLQWLQAHPADTPTRLHYASSLQADHQYQPAIMQLDQIVQREPNNMVALNDMAWACLQTHDARAPALAERARKLAPDNAAVLDTEGWILHERGEGARALPLLQRASALAPAADEIRYHLSLALIKSGDARSAHTQLERLLKSPDLKRRAEVQALLAQTLATR